MDTRQVVILYKQATEHEKDELMKWENENTDKIPSEWPGWLKVQERIYGPDPTA